jgi:tetratricopeptide (TPR) repeat protein
MSFFPFILPPSRKGTKAFERARAAEGRSDDDAALTHFTQAAASFDAHFLAIGMHSARASHLVMAGISYTRIGRNEDALMALDRCLELKDIPDASLHAGYAAAQLGLSERAKKYWEKYPVWAEQRIIASALNKAVHNIKKTNQPNMQQLCESIALAMRNQDRENIRGAFMTPNNQDGAPKRGY